MTTTKASKIDSFDNLPKKYLCRQCGSSQVDKAESTPVLTKECLICDGIMDYVEM